MKRTTLIFLGAKASLTLISGGQIPNNPWLLYVLTKSFLINLKRWVNINKENKKNKKISFHGEHTKQETWPLSPLRPNTKIFLFGSTL